MSVGGRVARLAGHWRGLPADARRAWRLGGFAELRLLLAERSVHLVYRYDRMVVIAQPLGDVRPREAPDGVTIGLAGPADIESLGDLVSGRDLGLFRGRVAAGHTCLMAWRDGRTIGYTWLAERMGPDVSSCPLPLPRDAAYVYDLYVAPAERSHGIGSALVNARNDLARVRGFAEAWRMVSVDNAASLRTIEKTSGPGTRVVGQMSYVKLLDRIFPRFVPRDGRAA